MIGFPLPNVSGEFTKDPPPPFLGKASVKLWSEIPRRLQGRKPLKSWRLVCARSTGLPEGIWPLPSQTDVSVLDVSDLDAFASAVPVAQSAPLSELIGSSKAT